MRMILKGTGITQTSDSHLSVHLHGKHGSAQLNLPTDQRVGLNVGSEFTLSLNGLGFSGAIDESVQSTGLLGEMPPPTTL